MSLALGVIFLAAIAPADHQAQLAMFAGVVGFVVLLLALIWLLRLRGRRCKRFSRGG